MSNIPDDLLPAIYDVSKKVYDKKMSLTEGSEYLFNTHNLNAGSAKIYIIDFKHLMEGTEFKRTLKCIFYGFFAEKYKKRLWYNPIKIIIACPYETYSLL